MIEVLVVVALLAGLSAAGIIVGADFYQRSVFRSDVETAVTLLEKARASAFSHIGETSHGVYFGDPESFILFRGTSYGSRDPSFDFSVEKNKAVVSSGPQEILFAPLAGESAGGNVVLSDRVRKMTITINNEGGINW